MKSDILLLRPKGLSKQSRIFALEQLGLSYISAYARQSGLIVEIIDGYIAPEKYDYFLENVENVDYLLIGFTIYPETLRRVAKDVKKLRNRNINIHVTIGNHLATLCGEIILSEFSQFDSAIKGEGEITFTELAIAIKENQSFSNIKSLIYKNENKIVSNPSRPNVLNLDTIPFPSRDTLALVLEAGNCPLIYSSRGCHVKCSFCSVHNFFNATYNGGWRYRTAKNVVDEMEMLFHNYHVKEFAFADEQFMGNGITGINRAIEIADEIINRKLDFRWYIETRSSDINFKVFEHLKKAGLQAVFMGIESGSDKTLLTIFKKGIRAKQHIEAVKILKELEILTSVGFIMFHPFSTLDELKENIEFLTELEAVEVTTLLTKLRVYPGTAMETFLKEKNILTGEYYAYEWNFQNQEVKACFDIIFASAEDLTVMYNEFAKVRRLGILSFKECVLLQKLMIQKPVEIFRKVILHIEEFYLFTEIEILNFKYMFEQACEDYIVTLKFIEITANKRKKNNSVQLLAPMVLC